MRTIDDGRMAEIRERQFWSRVDASGDCWAWESYRNTDGYGLFSVGRRAALRAHRYAYTSLVGPIPRGLQLDHLCRNRACVNPDHLELVTPRENTMRGVSPVAVNAQKSACDNGHDFVPESTWVDANGWRRCRICRADANRRWRERRREGASNAA